MFPLHKNITALLMLVAVLSITVYGENTRKNTYQQITIKTNSKENINFIEINEMTNQLKLDKINALKRVAAVLKNNGYTIDNKSFSMNFNDNTVYLDTVKIPDDVAKKVFLAYTQDTVITIPTGINAEIKHLESDFTDIISKLNEDQKFLIDDQKKILINEEILKQERKKIDKFRELLGEELKKNGYDYINKPFSMKFKYLWNLQFQNTAYLDNKKLPKDLTERFFTLYKSIFNDPGNSTVSFELPNGINNNNIDIINTKKKESD